MILNNESNKKKKFEQFFIMTYPKVKAFAWKLLKSEEDAEDIAQDIFANYGLILRFGKIRKLGTATYILWSATISITF